MLQRLINEAREALIEGTDEKLIQRARAILGMGVDEKEAMTVLVKAGVSRQDAYLAVKAAKVLDMGEDLDEKAATRVRARQRGKGSKRTMKKCPVGMQMKGGRCVRIPTAVKRKRARLKKKWGRTGAGKKSRKKSARLRRRFS